MAQLLFKVFSPFVNLQINRTVWRKMAYLGFRPCISPFRSTSPITQWCCTGCTFSSLWWLSSCDTVETICATVAVLSNWTRRGKPLVHRQLIEWLSFSGPCLWTTVYWRHPTRPVVLEIHWTSCLSITIWSLSRSLRSLCSPVLCSECGMCIYFLTKITYTHHLTRCDSTMNYFYMCNF